MVGTAVVGDVWEAGIVVSFDRGSSQGFLKVEGRNGTVRFFKRPAKDAGFSCEDLVPETPVDVLIKEGEHGGGLRAWKFKPKTAS